MGGRDSQTSESEKYINPYKLFIGSFIPNWLLCRSDISFGAKLIYAKLCQYAGKNGKCWPNQVMIGKDVGCSARQVKRYIKELFNFKLISLIKEGFPGKNVYKFLYHPWMGDISPVGTDVAPLKGASGDRFGTSVGTDLVRPIIRRESIRESKERYIIWFEEVWKEYPNRIGKTKAKERFLSSIKTNEDFNNIKTALANYLKHLKRNPWKQPQDGKTWFSSKNWPDWLEHKEEEPTEAQEAGLQLSPFEKTIKICEKNLSGQITKEAIKRTLMEIPRENWGLVSTYLRKIDEKFEEMFNVVVKESIKGQERVKEALLCKS